MIDRQRIDSFPSALPWGVRHSSAHYLGFEAKTAFSGLKNTKPGCGASTNENKINRGAEKSAGVGLKGLFPKKDGALANLFSEAFVASARLSELKSEAGGHGRVAQLGLNWAGSASSQTPQGESDQFLEGISEHGSKYILG